MKRLKHILIKYPPAFLLLVSVLSLFSCHAFTEDCHYMGGVAVRMDWSDLGPVPRPDSLVALFYHPGYGPEIRTLRGDTVYDSITAGETTMLLLNVPPGLELHTGDSPGESTLTLPTRFEGSLRVSDGCPPVCVWRDGFMVPVEDIIHRTAVPRPLTKLIILKAYIVREGVTADVDTCLASLSGISTVYNLGTGEASQNDATVRVQLRQAAQEEEHTDTFTGSFHVPGVKGENPNRFSVYLVLEDGETRRAELDLTRELSTFTEDIFTASIRITITALGMDISVGSWSQGSSGEIIIQ